MATGGSQRIGTVLVISLALVISACQQAAPSPAPAKPTEAAKPAAQPAASPAAAPAAPAAAPAASPAAAGALSGKIKLVSSLPRTGANKGQSDSMVNAFKMALDEVNYKIGDATIEYEDMDDATPAKGAWDAGKEAENANKAVNDPDVMVYLGTFNSGAAKVSIPILNRADLAMFSPANTYPGLTKKVEGVEANEPDVYYPNGIRNYFRDVAADDIQGAVGAGWAKDLGAKKVYILDDTELYGHGIAVVFANTANKIGLEVAGGPEGVDVKASDYRALMNKIKATGADLVYYGSVIEHNPGKIAKDMRAILGPSVKYMVPDGVYVNSYLDDAAEAAEGTYVTYAGIPAAKLPGKGQEWYQNYKKKFDQEPESYGVYSYEAMKVTLDAIKKAGVKDRAKIRDAIAATKDYDGVLGRWSFDKNGDTNLTDMTGLQVKNGKWDVEGSIILKAPQ
jgi:branched-chain amino acid transport system substrate-binding protein